MKWKYSFGLYIFCVSLVLCACIYIEFRISHEKGNTQNRGCIEKPLIEKRSDIDCFFNAYEDTIETILSRRIYKKSPVTANLLRDIAEEMYYETCIIVPAKLVLAQAMFESHIGLKGRNPKTNPFNVGEYDDRTYLRFNTTCEGVRAYFNLMVNDYLRCKTPRELLNNFTNCNNLRYATDPNYELKLKRAISGIEVRVKKNNEQKTCS